MSEKSKSAKYSQSRSDTRIGNGMRVDGDINFTGVLQVQGTIHGDVSCDADGKGMIVVGQPGNVAGTLRAPHIVVGGRVSGPSYSSESIEIQAGAFLAGDTFYKEIEVRAGGVVEGWLTPRFSTDGDRPSKEPRVQPSAIEERAMPLAAAASGGTGYRSRSRRGWAFGGAAIVLGAIFILVFLNRSPAPDTPPGADVVLKAESSMNIAAVTPATSAPGAGPQDGRRDLAEDGVRPATGPEADKEAYPQEPTADLREFDPGKVVVVQGVNPGKPAGALSVVSEGPSVLFRKKRQDTSNGARIDVPNGASTISIARDEVFRVAEGRNIVIFYQGRKVAPKTIEVGAWMSFVPQSSAGALNKE